MARLDAMTVAKNDVRMRVSLAPARATASAAVLLAGRRFLLRGLGRGLLLLAELIQMVFPSRLVALVWQQTDAGLLLPLLHGLDRLCIERRIGERHLGGKHLRAIVVRRQVVRFDDLRLLAVRVARLVDGFLEVRGLDDELVAVP